MSKYINTERSNLFEPNVYINFKVDIDGRPPVDQLQSAVEKAFTLNESLMSRIVMDNQGQAEYQLMDKTGCSVTVTSDEWIDVINTNEKIPFAIDKGEMMRVFIKDDSINTSLFIMSHHLAGDGKSIGYFIEDILMILNKEECSYRPLQLLTVENMPDKTRLPLYARLLAKSINRKWDKVNKVFNWKDYTDIHNTYWTKTRSYILCRQFSPDDVKKIHDHAKEKGASINSCIITAFLESNSNIRNTGMPIAARPDGNKSMSNQTTGVSVKYRYKKNKSFDVNMGNVHKTIYKILDTPGRTYFVLKFIDAVRPTLQDSELFYANGLYDNKVSRKLSDISGYTGNKTRDLGVSNLTRLDIKQQYNKYSISNVVFVPPAISYSRQNIGIVTSDNGMNITYHYMGDTDSTKEKEFFDRAMDRLISL